MTGKIKSDIKTYIHNLAKEKGMTPAELFKKALADHKELEEARELNREVTGPRPECETGIRSNSI